MKKLLTRKYLISGLGGMVAGFLNGLFGSGGGTVIVPFLEEFLDQSEHKSHATAILIILSFTVISLLFYGIHAVFHSVGIKLLYHRFVIYVVTDGNYVRFFTAD